MNSKKIWQFTEEETIRLTNKMQSFHFDYKNYIIPYNESRDLIGRIVEEFQSLESFINSLLKKVTSKNINQTFNFDKCQSATNTIKKLKANHIVTEEIANQLINIIKFRNYIIHEHFTDNNRNEAEKFFPLFLFLIFEAEDYIRNQIDKLEGKTIAIRNVFDGNL